MSLSSFPSLPLPPSQCSSSYAFAVTGAVESLLALQAGPSFTPDAVQPFSTVPLSAQQLLDCDHANQGCAGGWPDYAWSYVTTNTLLPSTEYPYMAANGDSCHASPPPGTPGSIAGFQYVPPQSEVSLREVSGRVTQLWQEVDVSREMLDCNLFPHRAIRLCVAGHATQGGFRSAISVGSSS